MLPTWILRSKRPGRLSRKLRPDPQQEDCGGLANTSDRTVMI